MFDLYQAQDLGDYRQAELSRKIAAKQLVLSAKDTGFASTDDRISPARRAIAAVTDVLSAVGGALAAVGRRPHRILDPRHAAPQAAGLHPAAPLCPDRAP